LGEYTLFAFPIRFAEFKCTEYYTDPGDMVIAAPLASEIRGEPMAAPISTFSMESLILKSFHIRGPIGTGGGMYNGGMTPTKR